MNIIKAIFDSNHKLKHYRYYDEFELNKESFDIPNLMRMIRKNENKKLGKLEIYSISLEIGDISYIGKSVNITKNAAGDSIDTWTGKSALDTNYVLAIHWACGYGGLSYLNIDTGEIVKIY